MPGKMANIKEIFAANLKENRKKRGLTQEKMAELADMSLHYLATLELGGNFPSGDMLEKLAKTLEIHAYELFYPPAMPKGSMLHLKKSLISSIEKVINAAIKQTITKENQTADTDLQKEEPEYNLQALIHEINVTINKAVKNSFKEHEQRMIDKIEETVSEVVDQSVSKVIKETLAEKSKRKKVLQKKHEERKKE